jgi:hypothetical protein
VVDNDRDSKSGVARNEGVWSRVGIETRARAVFISMQITVAESNFRYR